MRTTGFPSTPLLPVLVSFSLCAWLTNSQKVDEGQEIILHAEKALGD